MRNEWSLTLSGERTPRLTQPARGMFLRRSKVWRNGRDGSYKWWRSWISIISDRAYPRKNRVELEIPSFLGRNFPSNDYVIAHQTVPISICCMRVAFPNCEMYKLRVSLSSTPGCRPRSKLDLHPPIRVHSPMSTDTSNGSTQCQPS
jgi:hypothetical protein